MPTTATSTRHASLDYLPVSLFGSVMGLSGLSIAWHLASSRFGITQAVADSIGLVAVLAFVAMTTAYLTKIVLAPQAVRAEFAHPIAGSLFGTFMISLLLLPIVLASRALWLAQLCWLIGAIGMLAFAWLMVNRWMSNRQMTEHATPAWIVPVVGLLDVPLALPSLHLPPLHGLMELSLAVGLFFAIPLFTMIFSRLLFHEPLPEAIQPTLMILVAPFAVGVSTYVAATGALDPFAEALYALTLFMLTVVVSRLQNAWRCCPFRIGWWAVGFPLAACAIASLRIAIAFPSVVNDAVAGTLVASASLVIAWLTVRTLLGIALGELRRLV